MDPNDAPPPDPPAAPKKPSKKKPKPATRRTQLLYDQLMSAYRERPGGHKYASERTGVSWRMARTAWESGWKGISWAAPIGSVLQAEADEVRLLAEQQRATREKDRRNAAIADDTQREAARVLRLRELAEDAQLLGSATKGAQALASGVLALAPAVAQMVRAVLQQFFDEGKGLDGRPTWSPKANSGVTADDALRYLSRIGTVAGKVALMADALVRLRDERRPPEEVVGTAEMSEEDLDEELRQLMQLADTFKDRDQIAAEAEVAAATGRMPPRDSGGSLH
jgi:hypothetical protein